jgi:hypothetical protein
MPKVEGRISGVLGIRILILSQGTPKAVPKSFVPDIKFSYLHPTREEKGKTKNGT